MVSDVNHPTFDEIVAMIKQMADSIAESGKPDVIVALARGGAVGGVMLSHALGVPVVLPSYSSKSGAGDDRDHDNQLPVIEGKKILIFDDILDTGLSVQEVSAHYHMNNDVTIAALYAKDTSCVAPTFPAVDITESTGFIFFPWEI